MAPSATTVQSNTADSMAPFARTKPYRRQNGTVSNNRHPHPVQDNRLFLRSRAVLHDASLTGFHTQSDRRGQIGNEDQEQNLKRFPHDRDSGDDAEEDLRGANT